MSELDTALFFSAFKHLADVITTRIGVRVLVLYGLGLLSAGALQCRNKETCHTPIFDSHVL